MPDSSTSEVYSSSINIPPTFPFILKQYAKAAIRTQPYDLLRWSAAYFRALAKGEEPPIKDRLEYPPPDSPSGLSPGYLKVLIKQIGKGGVISLDQLLERWNGICLAEEPLQEMLAVGQFGGTFDWLHFVAVAAGFLSHSLTQTMVLLCNLLTDEPDGGSAMIPIQTFTKLYTFLASLDCGDADNHDEDESQPEYIMTEGQADAASLCSHRSTHLKRESVESCATDPFLYHSNWDSHSAHQIFVETQSPFPSPPASRPSTPCLDMENASTTTLTPEGQHCFCQEQEGKKLEDEQHTDVLNIEKRSVSLQQNTVDEPEIISSVSVPNTSIRATKHKIASGHGDVEEKSSRSSHQEHPVKMIKDNQKESTSKRHVPGIGAVVDAVQMQAVLDYLEGVGLKQEGMVKPSNIRHFLCPPLEKVPASQKTRV
ncbi:hypothetical protein ONE63_003688 [Megalurothrips usitatus]|uniref:Ropporin-1-like protein n=1 Tax=Megalurothrips usitatus TaxID=439358 RepID=A0AAV7X7Q8_9NEOP|nr:hypothetical protein ONE63_003688 [Megalurothrips usitatus]